MKGFNHWRIRKIDCCDKCLEMFPIRKGPVGLDILIEKMTGASIRICQSCLRDLLKAAKKKNA